MKMSQSSQSNQVRKIMPPLGERAIKSLYVMSIGILVAVNFALAKYMVTQGVVPINVAVLPMVGAAVILMMILWFGKQWQTNQFVHYRYYVWAGLLGVSIPNLASSYALQGLNASSFSVIVTLSPILTLLLAIPFERQTLSLSKVVGILLGALAALMVTSTPNMESDTPWFSFAIALLVPLFLAAGNVYRSKAFPLGANPIALAAGVLLVQSVLWLPFTKLTGWNDSTQLWGLGLMAIISALSYLLTFRFQQMTDGVGFSQVGNVVTVSGVSIGIALYGEPLTGALIMALFLLFSSIYLFNKS